MKRKFVEIVESLQVNAMKKLDAAQEACVNLEERCAPAEARFGLLEKRYAAQCAILEAKGGPKVTVGSEEAVKVKVKAEADADDALSKKKEVKAKKERA